MAEDARWLIWSYEHDALRGHARLMAMVETYFNVPRRLKKAWKKTQTDRTLRSGERHRLSRVLRQLEASS
jgi:hypothetical protein